MIAIGAFGAGAWALVQGSRLLQGVLLSGAVVVGLWVALETNNKSQQAKGAAEIVTKINIDVTDQVDAAIQESMKANEPGSDDRLHSRWCRDC